MLIVSTLLHFTTEKILFFRIAYARRESRYIFLDLGE